MFILILLCSLFSKVFCIQLYTMCSCNIQLYTMCSYNIPMIRIWEIDIMFIKFLSTYIGIRKHEILEIGSGTKLLFTFLSLKVFRQEERETHNLSMLIAFTSSALNPTNAQRL